MTINRRKVLTYRQLFFLRQAGLSEICIQISDTFAASFRRLGPTEIAAVAILYSGF